MDDQALVAAADRVRRHAHAPYSGLRVGAAVLDADGNVFTGTNVENASFGLTICAERAALFAAVAAGALDRGIVRLALVTRNGYWPCGACRQVILELAPDAEVLIATPARILTRRSAADLLPDAFDAFEPD
jgi:cytidine deaminase